jgi:hypothetical protein
MEIEKIRKLKNIKINELIKNKKSLIYRRG